MLSRAIIVVLLVVVSCVSVQGCSGSTCPVASGTNWAIYYVSSTVKSSILSTHNSVRAAVKIPSQFVWDDIIVTRLKNYFYEMYREGNLPSGTMIGHTSITNQGENIFASTASFTATSGATIVNAWASEKNYYTYGKFAVQNAADNSQWCNQPAPQGCGHYTQIVWESSTRLGCIQVKTDTTTYKYATVCGYTTPGNVNAAGCTPANKATCYYPYVLR
jgi:pathogenesis-related protein 1